MTFCQSPFNPVPVARPHSNWYA